MQVFDLSRLLDAEPGTTFDQDAFYGMVSSSHNIVANDDQDVVVLTGTDTCSGGLHIVDVSDPTDPTFAGCFEDHGYVHDSQCVTYDGPDREHRGKNICVSSVANFFSFSPEGIDNAVSVVDITDPFDPEALSLTSYDGQDDGYSHQGWLTEDQATFLHGDELDEVFGQVPTTTTRVFDVSDLDAPSLTAATTNGNTSIDHNLFVDGDRVLAGNYTSGLRVLDASDAADGELPEVAWFDTYPENDDPTFEGGVWGTYPYFQQSKLVAVSTIDRGLFLLKPRGGGR
jgi:choice-of-anchor B domain-containing protein